MYTTVGTIFPALPENAMTWFTVGAGTELLDVVIVAKFPLAEVAVSVTDVTVDIISIPGRPFCEFGTYTG